MVLNIIQHLTGAGGREANMEKLWSSFLVIFCTLDQLKAFYGAFRTGITVAQPRSNTFFSITLAEEKTVLDIVQMTYPAQ